jgi:hypothetical protein
MLQYCKRRRMAHTASKICVHYTRVRIYILIKYNNNQLKIKNMEKYVNEINQLTKYFWSTEDLLVRIGTLEKCENLSIESKNKLSMCKETLLNLSDSIRDRISKIMISIYIK